MSRGWRELGLPSSGLWVLMGWGASSNQQKFWAKKVVGSEGASGV